MKNYIYAILLVPSMLSAQEFRGIVVYESKSNPTIYVEGESDDDPNIKELKRQLGKSHEKTLTLKFDRAASVYEEQQKLDSPVENQGNVIVKIAPMGMLYKNLKEKQSLLEADFFSKEFIVVDSLKDWQWKLLPETKKIGNYNCYKAVSVQKSTEPVVKNKDEKVNILSAVKPKDFTVTAWYTIDIPVSHGPGKYWGLPGLILEVNDGQTSILCSKITLQPKEKIEIKAPKKGEKVTRAEMEKIIEKKSQEFMDMNSSPGSTTKIIRIGG